MPEIIEQYYAPLLNWLLYTSNRPGQHQHPVQVKLPRPQKLHDRVKQQEQAAGDQALQNGLLRAG